MSEAWIKVRTVLPTDGRLRIASRKCHASTVTCFGALVTLWCLADSHADENGVLNGYTVDDIDSLLGVPGFCNSLPEEWLDVSGEFVKLPNYQQHNGSTGRTRAQATKRQQLSRSQRDTSVTREEKKREEKKEEKRASTGSKKKLPETTFRQWSESLDGDAIPADDPIFDWAIKAGLPREWVALGWWAFESRYLDDPKTYADWRAVFRRALREDWLRLWRKDSRSGQWVLTTTGETALAEMRA